MSDLEISDDDLENPKKTQDDENDEDDVKKSSNKKIITEFVNDEIDDEDDDDDDDDDEEEFIDLKEDDLQIKNLLSKEKLLDNKVDDVSNELEIDNLSPINSEIDSDDENELQKFENELNKNYVKNNHPECLHLNNNEIEALSQITRDENGIIIDNNHKTMPILTKYEKTKILGQRAKQINNGDQPYINIPKNIIDGYIIAEMELKQKKIPFIIRRPLANGTFEYWKISDLELI